MPSFVHPAEDHRAVDAIVRIGFPGARGTKMPQSRYALGLFGLYVALYGGLVGLNAFAVAAMEWSPLAGINLAVWYGLGLIIAAFALAVLYNRLCRNSEDQRGASS
jgi:uncharacterized membrane protein (DUF485 family)